MYGENVWLCLNLNTERCKINTNKHLQHGVSKVKANIKMFVELGGTKI